MAVDTPVLDRTSERKTCELIPSRISNNLAEEVHNARIKETYARLINPNNRIEDVFDCTMVSTPAPAPVVQVELVQNKAAQSERPYFVENARATASIFRADSAINAVAKVEEPVEEIQNTIIVDEEDEDLRPTATTIQYQTIGKNAEQNSASLSKKSLFSIGKKEKIIIAVFIAVVVALITLIIVNSAIITNLNNEIASVQDKILTVRGSIAGVTSTLEQTVLDSLGK